ncbi:GyrI-like domain-containing protein [Motiliproteus sp. MSK22-1]|uniref:GyrI-like domain-containing protein n=1 Tax=Motiliproteus sp. MSK22-1 TaxID=1897630 RepID=UPI000977E91C|nr:GyrI-like domain-containing protein [Motiliproteus sp. MSK22-1]OMH36192.1 hypothetical protein BGP75_10145 [Motiliproteus sp. MSK22-1]
MKLDLFKENKADYVAPKQPKLVSIKECCYLAINGQGAPGSAGFQEAIEALYAMAYTIKMTRKAAGKGDYTICKLEAQWWYEGNEDVAEVSQDQWSWQLLIRTPDTVEQADLQAASEVLIKKGKSTLTGNVQLIHLEEGRCLQVLHVGPYEDECRSIELLKDHAKELGLVFSGNHHEIYISDPRRTPAERLKTILRYPVSELEEGLPS